MTIGKSIKIKLPDGNLDGCIEISLAAWSGVAYRIKREKISIYKDNTRLKQSGVYFLYGESNNSNGMRQKRLYIGQGGKRKNGQGVLARVIDHDRKDESYWEEAIVFVDKEDSFGKTELCFLENQFTNMALAAKKTIKGYSIENGNDPNIGNVTEEKQWELEEYISGAVLILESMRYDFFVKEYGNIDTLFPDAEDENLSHHPNTPSKIAKVQPDCSPEDVMEESFFEYLNRVCISPKTAQCYINNCNRLEIWLKEKKLLAADEMLSELKHPIVPFCESLLSHPEFIALNKEKHYNFSAMLKKLLDYGQGKKSIASPSENMHSFPKIGVVARIVLKHCLENGLFSEEIISFLLSRESGRLFKTDGSRPILLSESSSAQIYDKNNKARYSPDGILINDTIYYIYTQLRSKGLPALITFFNTHGISNEKIIELCKK